MTVITVHSRLLAASTPICPVVHATLNWILIATLLAFTLTIAGAVAWSIVDHKLAFRSPNGNDAKRSPSGERAGGHGALQVPQTFDPELDA